MSQIVACEGLSALTLRCRAELDDSFQEARETMFISRLSLSFLFTSIELRSGSFKIEELSKNRALFEPLSFY